MSKQEYIDKITRLLNERDISDNALVRLYSFISSYTDNNEQGRTSP